MQVLQVVVGALLMIVALVTFLRTRRLVSLLTDLHDKPLSQSDRDRILTVVFGQQLIAALTLIAGLAVVLLSLAD